MKEKLKKNANLIIGLFFIWVLPIILLITMACNGKTTSVRFKSWGIVFLVIYLFAYFIAIKKQVSKAKDRQLTKDGYVHAWVRIVEFTAIIVPIICLYLFLETIKSDIHESQVFVLCCGISITVGYLFLIADSKQKEKDNNP